MATIVALLADRPLWLAEQARLDDLAEAALSEGKRLEEEVDSLFERRHAAQDLALATVAEDRADLLAQLALVAEILDDDSREIAAEEIRVIARGAARLLAA